MRIRGGSGLGDALYVRAVGEYLISEGHPVTACSDYPGVFVGSGIKVEPFRRDRVDRLAHYSARKGIVETNQWEDVCDSAGIERIAFHVKHRIINAALVAGLRELAAGKPLVLVHGGRAPMARTDGFGKELLPKAEAFGAVLEALSDCFLVQIGQGNQLYPLDCDVSLNGSTSVTDLLDLGASCDGVVAQCSYAVPLAEGFDKPALFVWAAAGMNGKAHQYVKQITPRKVLSKASSRHVTDDCGSEQIKEAVRVFRDAIGSR